MPETPISCSNSCFSRSLQKPNSAMPIGCCDFGSRNRARPADDQISLGKPLCHVPDEGHYLRVDFAPRIRHTHSIIVALAGLMNDRDAILVRGQHVPGIHERAVDDERALAASGNQNVERLSRCALRHGEKFRSHGNSCERRLAPPELRGRLVSRGDTGHHAREHAVGESRLSVRLEDYSAQAAQYGSEDHRSGRVSPDSQRDGKLVAAQDRKGVPHRGSELRDIPDKFHSTDALEARRANRLERKPRLRHQTSFNPALSSDEHHFPFRSSRHPFTGHGQRGKNVPARPASRNQQLQILLPRFLHAAS